MCVNNCKFVGLKTYRNMRIFRFTIGLWILVFLLRLNIFSQTVLSRGDISIIGFNGTDPDGISFVTWTTITSGTKIKFTDNAFLAAVSANAANNARGGEGFVVWTANATVNPGSVVTIDAPTWVCNTGTAASYGTFNLSTSGDNIFAYQGAGAGNSVNTCDWGNNTNPSTFTGTILYGLVYASNWLVTGTATANTTYRPTELATGNTSIAITNGGTKNAQYTNPRNDQQNLADYNPIVANAANWTAYAGSTALDATDFTVAGPPPTPTITITGTLSTSYAFDGCVSSVNSYSVSGAALTDDITLTSPTGFEISLNNNGPFSSTLVLSQAGGVVPSTTIYVRFHAACVCTTNGTITHNSLGATPQNQSVTGIGTEPTVVINKYGIASDDVELLVVKNGTSLAGMTIKDFSSNMANDNGGSYTFKNVAPWTSLPKGTIVILRGGSVAAPDIDPSDFLVEIGLDNTTYFTKNSGTFNIATTEMVMLKESGSGTSGVNGNIHTLSAGAPSSLYNSILGPKMNNSTTPGSNSFIAATSTNGNNCDFGGGDVSILASVTFGSGNNTNNQNYICGLRGNMSAPTITGPTTLCSGNTLSLSTSVSGATSYYWTGPNGFTATTAAITINNATASESGDYLVSAIFGASCSTAVAQHSVTIAPCSCPMATGLSTTQIQYNNATFNWTIPTGPFLDPADSVKLYIRKVGANFWYRTLTFVNQNTHRQYQLQPGINYEWKIVTYCSGGGTNETNLETFSTIAHCGMFSNLTATPDITYPYSTVNVSWAYSPGSADSFDVFYRVTGTQTAYKVVKTNSNSAIINNLDQNTTYEWKVRAYCNGLTNGSNLATFTTELLCAIPYNLSATNIQLDRATLSWDADSGMYYQISFRPLGNPTWVYRNNISAKNVIQGNLLNSTTYEWRVRAYCIGFGSWSATQTFTTIGAKTGMQSAASVGVYPNPSNGIVYLTFDEPNSQVVNIHVLDITGKVVLEQKSYIESDYQQVVLDITQLPVGVYQLRLEHSGNVSYTKIVKE